MLFILIRLNFFDSICIVLYQYLSIPIITNLLVLLVRTRMLLIFFNYKDSSLKSNDNLSYLELGEGVLLF